MGKGACWLRVGPAKSVLGKPHTSVSGLVGRGRAALGLAFCVVHKLPNVFSGPKLRLVNADVSILPEGHEVEN